MTKLEKFGLLTGIIGLLADLAAIITFLAGLWYPTKIGNNMSNNEMPAIFQIISGLLILYGWFTISVFISVRAARTIRSSTKKINREESVSKSMI